MDNKKILIVEDEVLNAKFLKMQLARKGINVYKSVESGAEAIKEALKERPEIIIMDIRLIGSIDGIQAAEEILKEYDASIIYVTGYNDHEIRERANRTKHSGYLLKPLDINDLLQILNSLIGV